MMNKFSITGFVLALIGAVGLTLAIRSSVIGSYEYEKRYGHRWELADKSSTIAAKATLVRDFIGSLRAGAGRGDFSDNNAIWLRTRNNELSANMDALETLAGRLEEIATMDPASFQYNTAIQQITAQEQGEAGKMIGAIHGCFMLQNYPLAWDWIGVTILILSAAMAIIGGVMLLMVIIEGTL